MTNTQRILDSIRRLVRHMRVSERAAEREIGLSGAQLTVIKELGKAAADSLKDLAERTCTDQSSVSVVVSRLVESGLVSRERDTADTRRCMLSLTERGNALLRRTPESEHDELAQALELLPPADRKRFADTFELIVRQLNNRSIPREMAMPPGEEMHPARSAQ